MPLIKFNINNHLLFGNCVALVCFAVLVWIETAAMSNAEEKVIAAETAVEGEKSETKVCQIYFS